MNCKRASWFYIIQQPGRSDSESQSIQSSGLLLCDTAVAPEKTKSHSHRRESLHGQCFEIWFVVVAKDLSEWAPTPERAFQRHVGKRDLRGTIYHPLFPEKEQATFLTRYVGSSEEDTKLITPNNGVTAIIQIEFGFHISSTRKLRYCKVVANWRKQQSNTYCDIEKHTMLVHANYSLQF